MTSEEYKNADRAQGVASGRACIFAALLPDLRAAAKSHGYAIGIHGSFVRDCDLIAVPWSEPASSADELADALQTLLGGWCGPSGAVYTWPKPKGNPKPFGRVAYTLRFGGEPLLVIDLSVTPRV